MADGALKTGGLTIICVTDYEVVRELLGASDAELHGTTLINLTSGSSAQAREAARWTEQRGARYLDGAVSTLNVLGTVTYLGADHGLASLYDVAGLAVMWSVLNAWLQGTALLRTAERRRRDVRGIRTADGSRCGRPAAGIRRADRR